MPIDVIRILFKLTRNPVNYKEKATKKHVHFHERNVLELHLKIDSHREPNLAYEHVSYKHLRSKVAIE